MSECNHKFTRFKRFGFARTYTCELCEMDIDSEVFKIITALESELAKRDAALKRVGERYAAQDQVFSVKLFDTGGQYIYPHHC